MTTMQRLKTRSRSPENQVGLFDAPGEETTKKTALYGADESGRRQRKPPSPIRVIALVAVVGALMIFSIWQISTVNQGLKEIDILKKRKLELQKSNEAIRSEILQLGSYKRIEALAREHLRMKHSENKPTIIMVDGKHDTASTE